MVNAREAPLSPTVLVLTSRSDVAAYAEEVLGSAGVPVSVANDEDGARTIIGKRDSKIGLLLVDVEAPRID
jgi:DNA-binding response OmpR family regulator